MAEKKDVFKAVKAGDVIEGTSNGNYFAIDVRSIAEHSLAGVLQEGLRRGVHFCRRSVCERAHSGCVTEFIICADGNLPGNVQEFSIVPRSEQ
jgi:hypothetical protein